MQCSELFLPLCNSQGFLSACFVEDHPNPAYGPERIPANLDSSNPRTLRNHTCSIGGDILILPKLTTTNREMIHYY